MIASAVARRFLSCLILQNERAILQDELAITGCEAYF
jgi:hypothetical protein